MKKVFFLLAALLVITATASADTKIQTEFDGIVLGMSTSNEVKKILTLKGMRLESDRADSTGTNRAEQYSGKYMHKEMYFNKVITEYFKDTLVSLYFLGNCDSACVDYGVSFIENIHATYDNLVNADSIDFVKELSKDKYEHAIIWSRTDEESIVLTIHNESICTCIYRAEKRHFEMALHRLVELIKKVSPDYAEENKVLSVAGVRFGDSKENVKRVISSKSARILSEDSYSLMYKDTKVGGRTYDYAIFYFKPGQGLVSANLQSAFYEWRKEEALMYFENIKSQYSGKYTNFKIQMDDEEEKICSCGAFTDGYKYLPISISFSKGLSNGGDIMYYVQVDYYYFSRKNLYNDEI